MPNKFYGLIVLLCLSMQSATAQVSFSSLQQVWDYADKHNIQIQTAAANKLITGKQVKQAYGSLYPAISVNGAFTDNLKIQSTLIPANLFNPSIPAGTYTEARFGRQYIYNGNIAAQMDLINTQDWFNIKSAKYNDEIAALNIAVTKKDLYEQLANAYYTLALLNEAEKLSAENVKTATGIYTIVQNKFNDGQVNEITLNTATINKEKAAKNLEIATQNKRVQLNGLKLLLNIPDSIAISEKTAVIIADTATFADDPAVQLAQVQLLLSKNEWKSGKAAFAPTLSAIYQYNAQISGDEFLKFGNSNSQPQEYVGLRLSIPLFSGNTRNYQVQKATIDLTLKQQQFEAAKLQSAINNQSVVIQYNTAFHAFENSKNILSLYQKNDFHAGMRANEGIIPLDERLKYYDDLVTNQQEYLQSMSDFFIQQYRLQIRQINFK